MGRRCLTIGDIIKNRMVATLNKQQFSVYQGTLEFSALNHRKSGKSHLLAVQYILRAVDNPGRPVGVVDHHRTIQANDMLCQQIARLLHGYERYFDIDRRKSLLTYTVR